MLSQISGIWPSDIQECRKRRFRCSCSSSGLPTRSRSADGRTAGSRPPASADFSLRVSTSAFQPRGEISPGKNALLRCTTAGSTPRRLDHESFVVSCPLALLGSAFYPILVHRLAASLHASSPQSVTLMQLRFASFAVINLRWDLHPQECARAGRTKKIPSRLGSGLKISSLRWIKEGSNIASGGR